MWGLNRHLKQPGGSTIFFERERTSDGGTLCRRLPQQSPAFALEPSFTSGIAFCVAWQATEQRVGVGRVSVAETFCVVIG